MEKETGFDIKETKRLFELCSEAIKSGKSLRTAFETIANETGKKPNSVRNYYYSHLKTLNMMPELSAKLGIKVERSKSTAFTLFDKKEVESLVREILIRQASGLSVRAITTELAKGDKSKMLRLQNKYRSVVFSRRKYAEEIMKKMRAEKLTFYNPYTKSIVKEGVETNISTNTLLDNIRSIIRDLGDEQVGEMFAGLARLAYLSSKKDQFKNEDSIKELEQLRMQNRLLQSKLERLNRISPSQNSNLESLREVNKYFLSKGDNDKIKSLSEYVSELGRILAQES